MIILTAPEVRFSKNWTLEVIWEPPTTKMKCTLIDLDVLQGSSSRSFRKCPFGPVIPRGCLFGYFSRLHPTPDTGSSQRIVRFVVT